MKRRILVTIVFVGFLGTVFSVAGSIRQAQDPGVLLRAAIEKQEVEGNLQGAIALYKQIIANHGTNAAVAAKALYRLGWCHEKLGSQEAQNAYRRLIDEYPGQKEEVALAKARLAALGATAGAESRKPDFRKIRIPDNPGNGVLSPDGKKFAFASQGSVWIVPIPGNVQPDLAGEPVRLTEPIGAWNLGNTMAWSGDGNWIAFNVFNEKEKGYGMYVVSQEGGDPRKIAAARILQGLEILYNFRLSLSNDGSILLFNSMDEAIPNAKPQDRYPSFLFTVPVRGGNAARLAGTWAYQQSFSRDARKIAYIQPADLETGARKSDLWIVNADGSNPVKLTDSPGRVKSPVFSPDGRMIAVTHQAGTDSSSREIWLISITPDGKRLGDAVKIELPSDSLSMLAGWTADDRIGLLMTNPFHQAVYTVPAAGGKATQVTPDAQDGYPCYPKWGPDGKSLYLRWGTGSVVSVPAQGGEFKTVHDSSKTNVIAGIPGGGYAVSPDGKTVVFMGGEKGLQPIEVNIWTAPVTGGAPPVQITQSLSPTQDRYPCWSPDGKSVAFLRYQPGADPIPQIYVTSSVGGAPRQITSDYNNVGLGSIDWSPDGKTIAYFSRDHKINLIPAAGGEHRVLLALDGHNWFNDLAWSPDGNEIAYTSTGRLMVVSLKGGQTREVQTGVLERTAQNFYIDWSPDGKKFAFSAGFGGDEELWLMENFLQLVKNKK